MKKVLAAVLALTMLFTSSLVMAAETETLKVPADLQASDILKTNYRDTLTLEDGENACLKATIDMSVVRDKFEEELKFIEETLNLVGEGANPELREKLDKAEVTGSFELVLTYDSSITLPEEITKGSEMSGFNEEASLIFREVERTVEDGKFTVKIEVVGPKDEEGNRGVCTVKELNDNLSTWLCDMSFDFDNIDIPMVGKNYKFTGSMKGNTRIQVASGLGQDIEFIAVPKNKEDIFAVVTMKEKETQQDGGVVTPSNKRPTPNNVPVVDDTPNSTIAVNQFKDVEEEDWFADAVGYVARNGYMNGTETDMFSPYLDTTRGMVTTILWRLAGSPSVIFEEKYSDVDPKEYYAQAITWGTQHRVVKGYPEGDFRPDQVISREEMAAVFNRYAVYKGVTNIVPGDLTVFADEPEVSEWAYENVQWAVGAGLMQGKGGDVFDPLGLTKRSELAAVIMRYCENIAK